MNNNTIENILTENKIYEFITNDNDVKKEIIIDNIHTTYRKNDRKIDAEYSEGIVSDVIKDFTKLVKEAYRVYNFNRILSENENYEDYPDFQGLLKKILTGNVQYTEQEKAILKKLNKNNTAL